MKTTRFKHIFAFLLSVVMVFSLFCGCAANGNDTPMTTPESQSTQPTEAEEPPVTTTPEVTEAEPTTEPEITAEPETTPEPTTTTEPTTVPEETTPAPTTEAPATTPAPETEPEFEVETMSAVMYANATANVRRGPGSNYERMGHIDSGDKLEVTGKTANDWYRIKFKDGEYFVGASYLSTEKPAVVTTAATTVATTTEKVATEPEKDDKMKEIVNDKWIAAWGCAMLTAGDDQTPKDPVLSGSTVRQQVRVTVDGNQLRLVLSNEYGKTPLEIESIKIAKLNHPKSSKIKDGTEAVITVNGKTSFTIPAGQRITTDVIDYEFSALDDIAVTMKLGKVPSVITCHTASRCTTWIIKGDHVSDTVFSKYEGMTAWYFLAELDTMAPDDASVIVCLGDSLTDGASVTTNEFARYTDELARLLRADSQYDNIAVVNMGIGATALYMYGGDIAGTNRANRDVLKVPGVKYCILFMGVNDIGAAGSDISSNIINEYKSIVKRCHENGIKVFGATITPFKGNGYYSTLHENIRKKVNDFVLSKSSGFDGIIDLASAVASASDPEKMESKYVSVWNDYLHFNDSGYKYVGQTVFDNIKSHLKED